MSLVQRAIYMGMEQVNKYVHVTMATTFELSLSLVQNRVAMVMYSINNKAFYNLPCTLGTVRGVPIVVLRN